MLLENLKEVCTILSRLEQAERKTLPYAAIAAGTRLTQKEVIALLSAMEREGCLSCTGRNYWDEPRGYRLLKPTGEISLCDLAKYAGCGILPAGIPAETAGGRKLRAAADGLMEALKEIYVNEVPFEPVY
jgi:hypothetical protein